MRHPRAGRATSHSQLADWVVVCHVKAPPDGRRPGEKIAQAARLVTRGKVFALGIPLQLGDFDTAPSPGLSFYTAPWLHAKQIAAAGVDNYAVEVRPSELPPFRSPLRIATIPSMGLTLGEIFYLEELAADCAQDRRWEFLLVAPPLPVTGAVGTPINPYAIK